MTLNKPIAVLISDIHYNIQTLQLADAAMRQAITKANDLEIPLIVAGDLHDTKANMRAECVNAMCDTFKLCKTNSYLIRGNHDSINEKSEKHSLEFLRDIVTGIADTVPFKPYDLDLVFVPYCSDTAVLRSYIARASVNSKTIVMHQGLSGTNSGEYIQDKTAITPTDVAGLRVISGHYHTRQTIDLPMGGKWDYIGNPYTLNFAEANDPKKGFQILYEDGSLEFVPTNLRKHIIYEANAGNKLAWLVGPKAFKGDLLWMKLTGTKEELAYVSKDRVATELFLNQAFKLDLIPTDEPQKVFVAQNLTLPQQLDGIIEKLQVTKDRKETLKKIWKDL